MGIKVYIKGFLNSTWIILIYAIIVFTPLAYSKQFVSPYQSTKILLFEVLVYLNIFFSLLSLKKQTIRSLKFNFIDLTIILFILFQFFLTGSLLDSTYYLPNLTLLTLFYFLLRLLFSIDKIEYNNVKKIYSLIILTCLIEGIIVFYEIIFKIFPSSNYFVRDKPNIYGTFGNPNIAAVFLAACLPFLFLLVRSTNSKIKKSIYVISIISLITVIVLSLSRGTWIALFIGLMFYYSPQIKHLYFKIKSRLLLKIGSVLVLCFLMIFSASILFKINERSIHGRLLLWQVTELMIQENIITGIGSGNFPVMYLDYQEKFFKNENNSKYLYYASGVSQPNNEYLLILAETGIFGFILFLIVFITIFKQSKDILKSKKVEIQSLGRVSLSSIVIILVHCLFDNPLHALPVYIILFFNIAVVSHLSNQKFRIRIAGHFYNKAISFFNRSSHTLIKKKIFNSIIRLTPLFFILLMPYLIYCTILKANAYYRWQKGIEYAIMNRWEKAINEYNYVLGILPTNGQLQFNLGAAYLNKHETKQAIYYLKKSLKTYKDKNTYTSLGYAYLDLSEFNKSISVFKEFENKFPNLLLPHLLLGKVYFRSSNFVNSKKELERLIKMQPKFHNDYAAEIKNEAARILRVINTNNIDYYN